MTSPSSSSFLFLLLLLLLSDAATHALLACLQGPFAAMGGAHEWIAGKNAHLASAGASKDVVRHVAASLAATLP